LGRNELIRITVIGGEDFQAFLAAAPQAIQKSLDGTAGVLADMTTARAQQIVPVKTGTLQRSIATRRLGLCNYAVETVVEYAPFVEFGTMYMRAQPFMRPALVEMAPRFADLFGEALRVNW
jgi:HK97 gp10 family phage protein